MSTFEVGFGPKNLNFRDPEIQKEIELIFAWLYQKNPHTTRRSYEYILKLFYEFLPGISFKDLKTVHLVQFLQNQTGKSQATQRLYKHCLSSLLTYLEKAEFIKINPSKLLDPIRAQDKLNQKILSQEQLRILISLESNLRNRFILNFLYLTGLRVSELQMLKWSDFVERESQWQLSVVGKGKKIRSLYISKKLDLIDLSLLNTNNYVTGSKLTTTQLYRIVKRAGSRVGIKNFSPHWLRHCHATHSLESGAPIHVVQKTLGHSSIETTGKYLSVIDQISSCEWISTNCIKNIF